MFVVGVEKGWMMSYTEDERLPVVTAVAVTEHPA